MISALAEYRPLRISELLYQVALAYHRQHTSTMAVTTMAWELSRYSTTMEKMYENLIENKMDIANGPPLATTRSVIILT